MSSSSFFHLFPNRLSGPLQEGSSAFLRSLPAFLYLIALGSKSSIEIPSPKDAGYSLSIKYSRIRAAYLKRSQVLFWESLLFNIVSEFQEAPQRLRTRSQKNIMRPVSFCRHFSMGLAMQFVGDAPLRH